MIIAPQFGVVRWDSVYRKERGDRMCGSKVRFPTEAVAVAAKRGEVPLRVYECPACKGWHLTKRGVV